MDPRAQEGGGGFGQWVLRLLMSMGRCDGDGVVENVNVKTWGILTEVFRLQLDYIGINPMNRYRHFFRKWIYFSRKYSRKNKSFSFKKKNG